MATNTVRVLKCMNNHTTSIQPWAKAQPLACPVAWCGQPLKPLRATNHGPKVAPLPGATA